MIEKKPENAVQNIEESANILQTGSYFDIL